MRILVVEDEEGLADSLRRGLSIEGHWVDVTHDGHRGLDLARIRDYDALVLDVMLPGLNGYEVCRRLRNTGDTTPILMLTAKDGEHDEAEGLDSGADDYLAKPFSFVVLLARLRALSRRAQQVQSTTLQAGDLVVDTVARRCRRAETEIELTARELAVLACVMAGDGDTVAKLHILHDVWDSPLDMDPNIVEVYISSLRKKVDVPFGRRAIRTVRGLGYRIAPDGG
ncbi:response regulator transcription factor [Streptomyces sioyaensis]|uniref:Response regulator transcription factor n=1 Tax=Streptomyces sioyaensis TaxID=67364 RepID=A0A4Q1QU79_9ACTN|nr:response regulator transcription factor [Streptomyces sioyaensis]MBM4790830.1 response regulator transcription factor [Streptomyces sioyaensis]RXS59788.1 response regulator transcription factor [Streptomyces sioyaensis]